MLPRLLLFLVMLAGLYFLIRWWRSGWRLKNQRLAITAIVIALLLLLIIRGGAEIAVPLLILLAPLLLRWRNTRPPPSPLATTKSHGSDSSIVTTRFLSVELNHATRAVSGAVREGRFAGQALHILNLQELLELWQECQSDSQSAAMLEIYLDRYADANWRGQLRHADSGTMSRAEAYQILGLQPDASNEKIQAAYRRLIQRVHPDQGGSAYLSVRLNQARKVLLG